MKINTGNLSTHPTRHYMKTYVQLCLLALPQLPWLPTVLFHATLVTVTFDPLVTKVTNFPVVTIFIPCVTLSLVVVTIVTNVVLLTVAICAPHFQYNFTCYYCYLGYQGLSCSLAATLTHTHTCHTCSSLHTSGILSHCHSHTHTHTHTLRFFK